MTQKTTLAFYVGRGEWRDRVIRFATRSAFSHVELLEPYEGHRKRVMKAISSSPRDGGVRIKEIAFKPHHWSFIDLEPWCDPWAWDKARQLVGQPYDWTAIALTYAVPLRRQSPGAWICSELVGKAIGLTAPGALSPGDLWSRVMDMNRAWRASQAARTPPS